MNSKLLLLGLGLIGGLALAGAGLGWFARPYTFHGSLIEKSVTAPDFTLRDQRGQSFRLGAQTGSVVLIYFGYTHCPDACPATMARFQQIRRQLGAEADRVNLVLVTTDLEVDTASVLGEYVAAFDPAIIGLTGTLAELEPVWQAYGVYVNKEPAGEVSHSDRIYAVDPQGNLRLTYTLDTPAGDIAADVRQLLTGERG